MEFLRRNCAGGVIFSDGIESDFLKFTSGCIVTSGIARETAKLVTGGKKASLREHVYENRNTSTLRHCKDHLAF